MHLLHLVHSPLFCLLARRFGVPSEKVYLEPESRNTREHVDRIMEFEGITEQTRLGVVSSDWHLRRIKMVLEREFAKVRFLGAPGRTVASRGLGWLAPGEWHLSLSAMCMREWVAILWYGMVVFSDN